MAAQEAAAGGALRARRPERQNPERTGLAIIRPDLEHKPKPADPFAVSVWPILDVLHDEFGRAFHVGYSNGWWWASPVSGTGERFRAISPDDLTRKIRAAGGSS